VSPSFKIQNYEKDFLLFGGEHCIIKTDSATIYADKDTYFYLGTNILYRITEEFRLTDGLNVVFRGGLY
jgi:hypothetical protein